MDMNNEANLRVLNYALKIRGMSMERCYEPTETCEQKAIRAHSIPSGTVLRRLSRAGHIVMFNIKFKFPSPPEISFKRVGKNKATTFSGLCAQHDNELFQPIDDQLPDLNNRNHLFLLAYRAVLREYHEALQSAILFQATYQKRVEEGLSPGTEPCEAGMAAVEYMLRAYECYEYKRHFDRYYLSREWSRLKHYGLLLRNQLPSVAVSSLFSLDAVDAPETPRATLTVFPIRTDVAVVLSAIPRDAPFVSAYLQRLLSSQSYFQKYLLSKLILESCENFVIAPQYYDSMLPERKEAICQFFTNTMFKNSVDHEDERLYLF